jgi:hypothetical protein
MRRLAEKKTQSPILQVKVTLAGIKPPVWRRLLVPSDISLRKFHDILQIAFGWTDSHLHMFEAGNDRYGFPDPDGALDWMKNDARVKLRQILREPKDSLTYEYDFGDSWIHHVVVEKVIPEPGALKIPSCTGGARAGPPDDCGGPWGYAEFLKAIGNPRHPDHEEMLEWIGGKFDSERFDVEVVNRELAG